MSSALRRLDPWPLLRGAPITLPQLLALLAIVTLSAAEGGFPLEHWAPAAVLTELLLAVALIFLPVGDRRPWGSKAGILLITSFALWTVASLLWADDQGAAAIASTRTAFLAATFVLFARWRQQPRTAVVILLALVAGLGLITWGVVIELRTVGNPDSWFIYDRLLEPIGYVNAGAAFWGVTALLAIGLAGGQLPGAYRLTGAAVAVPASALSLLCVSRGGLLAAGIVVALLLAFLPGRARNATAFLIAGLGVGLAVPSLLDVGPAVWHTANGAGVLRHALDLVIVGTVLAVAATYVWILIERRVPAGDERRGQASRLGAGVLIAVACVAAALAIAGVGPVTVDRVRHSVNSITQTYAPIEAGDTRLSSGLGSGRWDFWTVAWDEFQQAPVIGVGADNYRQDYLLHGKSSENPRYPHSMWLRSLGQLGIIGTLLLLGWVVVVAVAVRRLGVARDPAGRALALAAGGAFGLWVVHGSADWLMEFGGFSAIVAAVAGLVVAAAPEARRRGGDDVAIAGAPAGSRGTGMPLPRLGVPVGVLLLLIAAVWTTTQWIADRDRTSAAILAVDQPSHAADRADVARKLDPFGEQADSLLGALAVARGDLPAAQAAYLRAYERNPRAARPRMWLGVIASASGDEREARRWMRRAARAAPRDATIAALTQQLAQGETLDPLALQAELAARTASLVNEQGAAPPAATTPNGAAPATTETPVPGGG